MPHRALLIAFHFPPQAGSSGIQRTLSFSKHLGRYGWDPLVLSANARAYDVTNPSQLASLPEGLVVRRAFALDAKRHMGLMGRYPGFLALPDRWVTWWLAAVPAGLSLIRRHKPQLIWSTYPIATSHMIGLALHKITGLPWVADFRDPMLQVAYPSSTTQRSIYKWIEKQTIAHCHTAVFTTHSAMNAYRTRFPHVAAEKFTVIENGYDEDGFDCGALPPLPGPLPAGHRVTLVHSGLLYQTGRDPSCFLQAIAQLKQAGKVDAASLRIILRAPGDLPAINAHVIRYHLEDIVEVVPPVSYRDALHEMLAADGLIVFQGTQFNTQIPAKIYEYFRARKPILGLVDMTGETARVLVAAGFDSIAPMERSAEIEQVLARLLRQIRQRNAYIATEKLITSSSRIHRASQLAAVFDAAVKTNLKPAGVSDVENH